MLRLYICIIAIMFCSSIVFAQIADVQQLPSDPRIKSGSLANGLTYYIVKNDAIKGYADFAIAQKVGTSLEKGNQKGMCKMLELLSTRGTRNFTDSTIVKYLNSIGVPTRNIIFQTNADEILYTIEKVPVSRQNTMDSTLLILYNWMASINIDEEDIAQTMPMLKNSLIDEWDAQKRIDNKLIKELYPKSPYAQSITVDQINNLSTYSSKELRNFYYQWFRPDLQAVFVVGDIDLAKVETQVKSIFATIPKPLKTESRNYYNPKIVKGTQVLIEKDPEYNKTSVAINFLSKPLIPKYRLTSVPFIEAYFNDAISTLLLKRLSSGIVEQNLPISNVRINKGKFMGMTNLETFEISFETLPGTVYASISFMSGEINRIARYGFNAQEFSNSREMHFRELENIYDNRFGQPNSLFMKRVKESYLYGYSLASIEMHFEIMKEILYSLRSEQLNNYAAALLGNKDGVVISCNMPEAEGVEELSVDRIQDSFVNSLSKSEYTGKEKALVAWPKFVGQNNTQGAIVNSVIDPVTEATVYTLSNGIRVIHKQTTGSGDTVSFRAVSKGGLSVLKENYGRELEFYASDIANLSTVGGISRSDWERLFLYNNLALNARIDNHTEMFEGYCGAQSLEKLFHLVYLNFTGRESDVSSFDIYRRGKSYEALYRSLSPKNVFEDSVRFYNCSNKRTVPVYSSDYVNKMDYLKIHESLKGRFENPADFLFIFVGKADPLKFAELVEKYLCVLPGSPDSEDWVVKPYYSFKGIAHEQFLYQMVIPRTYVDVTISCGMQDNMKNRTLGALLQSYLQDIYSNGKLREFSPNNTVSVKMEYYPEEIIMCRQRFETDSAGAAGVMDLLNSTLQNLVYNNIPDERFAALKEDLLKDFHILQQKNSYWMDVYADSHLLGHNFHNGYALEIKNITPADFKDFVDKLYRRGNKITVIMEGTTEDVNTQNLFRENQFIKEFFDL